MFLENDILRDKSNGKIYIISNGKKRWIKSAQAALQNQIHLEYAVDCDKTDLDMIPSAATIEMYKSELSLSETPSQARAFLGKELYGKGVECGPGSVEASFPVPVRCKIKYLDRFYSNEGCNQGYEGDFPDIDYISTINDMSCIDDESLDFIVNCHVIEHSRDPIGALQRFYTKLKKGGILIMAVPDKRYTFDLPRQITSVKHLILDYEDPYNSSRDRQHLEECNKIWIGDTYKMRQDMSEEEIFGCLEQNTIDVHWHTFTPKSFKKALKKTRRIAKWKSCRIIDRDTFVNPDAFIEFYVVCKK